MKVHFIGIMAASFVILSACKKNLNYSTDTLAGESVDLSEAEPVKRNCASYEVLQRQLLEDPGYQSRLDEIEAFTSNYISLQKTGSDKNILLANDTLLLPVVVNVVYRTTAENISRDQILSQIKVLNDDFAGANADYNSGNTYNDVKAGHTRIKFKLDTIFRKVTSKPSWGTNNDVKKSSKGGINPTNPTRKLNIWVCNLGRSLLGYAQFPAGDSTTDGVVIHTKAFGTIGSLYTAYNKGRTTTHEVGHWFNLRHIWGDATCGNDQVDDTPTQHKANYGCPGSITGCSSNQVEMTWNYMDYTDDACMYMFSAGQGDRMRAVFALGGPREKLRN